MSTRAIIKFQDGDEIILVDRSHDGFPEVVLKDIEETIELAKGRWSGAEMGALISLHLAKGYHYEKARLPHYEIITGMPGDECYIYFARYDHDKGKWVYGLEEDEPRYA